MQKIEKSSRKTLRTFALGVGAATLLTLPLLSEVRLLDDRYERAHDLGYHRRPGVSVNALLWRARQKMGLAI